MCMGNVTRGHVYSTQVHVATCFNNGLDHVWYINTLFVTMVLRDL